MEYQPHESFPVIGERRIACPSWDYRRGQCPASFVGDERHVLWAAQRHATRAHGRTRGPRLDGELRALMTVWPPPPALPDGSPYLEALPPTGHTHGLGGSTS